MIRPILSLQRLSFDETEGRLLYQYDKGNLEPERMDYLEFIARVTSHIPDKGQVTLRYYGLYSNAHRDKFAFFVFLFLCVILDLIFFPVICSFQDISEWKLRKIVRDLLQAQKGNSFLLKANPSLKKSGRVSELFDDVQTQPRSPGKSIVMFL